MSIEKQPIDDQQLEQVTGGFLSFNRSSKLLTQTCQDGSVCTYKILNYDKAWALASSCNGNYAAERQAVSQMISKEYRVGND